MTVTQARQLFWTGPAIVRADEHMHKCMRARDVWGHAPKGKLFSIGRSEIASNVMFGPKCSARIKTFEASEPSCLK